LKLTIDYIKEMAPHVIVLVDAKRGDIGNTAAAYSRALFGDLGADCVTLSPYLGWDSLKPFLEEEERGAFVLCKTSNPSGKELQDIDVMAGEKSMKFYQYIAKIAAGAWNVKKNVGLVVGATYPEELKDVRDIVGGDMPLLIPGIGAQGGDLERSVKFGCGPDGFGILINSSRGIIFKDPGPDFAKFSGEAAQDLRKAINQFR
jgi:orotidine-5'-phosphate decarboxylase